MMRCTKILVAVAVLCFATHARAGTPDITGRPFPDLIPIDGEKLRPEIEASASKAAACFKQAPITLRFHLERDGTLIGLGGAGTAITPDEECLATHAVWWRFAPLEGPRPRRLVTVTLTRKPEGVRVLRLDAGATYVDLANRVHVLSPDGNSFWLGHESMVRPRVSVAQHVESTGALNAAALVAAPSVAYDDCWHAARRLGLSPAAGRARLSVSSKGAVTKSVVELFTLPEVDGVPVRMQAREIEACLEAATRRVPFPEANGSSTVEFAFTFADTNQPNPSDLLQDVGGTTP